MTRLRQHFCLGVLCVLMLFNMAFPAFASSMVTGTPLFTNLANVGSVDWLVDSRISSSGAIKASEGAVVTNFIPVKRGDTLRVKGLDLRSVLPDGVNSPSILGYDSSGTIVAGTYVATTSYADLFIVDDNGVVIHVLYQSYGGEDKDDVTQVRLCGTPVSGEAIIITVNEDIAYSSPEPEPEPEPEPKPNKFTLGVLMSDVNTIFAKGMGMVGSVVETVVSYPILYLSIVIGLCGIGVAFFNRLKQ